MNRNIFTGSDMVLVILGVGALLIWAAPDLAVWWGLS